MALAVQNTIVLVDAINGAEKRHVSFGLRGIASLAYTTGDKALIAVERKGNETALTTWSVWTLQLENGQSRRIADGLVNDVAHARVSSDGHWLAVPRKQRLPYRIELFDTDQPGGLPLRLVNAPAQLWSIEFVPNQPLILLAATRRIKAWNFLENRCVARCNSPEFDEIEQIAPLSDGKTLAMTTAKSPFVSFWSIDQGTKLFSIAASLGAPARPIGIPVPRVDHVWQRWPSGLLASNGGELLAIVESHAKSGAGQTIHVLDGRPQSRDSYASRVRIDTSDLKP